MSAQMSMVERVARALRRQWHIDNFDRASDVGWEDEINAARAAIEAMGGPTDAMIGAGQACDAGTYEEDIPRIFTAMIDAALRQ